MTEISSKTSNITVSEPSVTPEGNLRRYLQEINSIPMLEEREEYALAKSWIEQGNMKSAHHLVTSHLRLVAKIAGGYRGYGLPYEELISEGNIGMMQAVKKFHPDKGARLSTYASWWIKATIQEYILRSWSLVKIGTTSAQKKLFFKLRSVKEKIGAFEKGDLTPKNLEIISETLNVRPDEVQSMNRRMDKGGDLSLNAPVKSGDGESAQWEDWLESDTPTPEEIVVEKSEKNARQEMLKNAMTVLNMREMEIITARRLEDKPVTLDALSQRYDISKERVRQIENKAFEKLQISMQKMIALPSPKSSE